MSRKANNTIRMWAKEGYMIEKMGRRYTKNMTLEITLRFKNQSGQPVNFYEDRVKMKNLAKRQDFIAIPLTKDNGSGLAEVLLVNHKLIYRIPDKLQELWEDYNKGYWRLQGDVEYLNLLNKVIHASETLYELYQLTKKMHSDEEGSHIEFYHDGFISAYAYTEFKKEIHQLTQEMKATGKFDENRMKLQENIASLYE